jgi:hypothetical protein
VAFTGRLGTEDSQWGNLFLGSEGGDDTPTQSLQMRANIVGVNTQTLQMRAFIARPEATLEMRAHIRGAFTLDMRARILGIVTSSPLAIEYDVLERITERLPIRFEATDKDRNFKAIQMRARIQAAVTAGLAISYDVDYTMPSSCAVTRPTQRSYCRAVRTLSMRARLTNG